MKSVWLTGVVLSGFLAAAAQASDLNLRVTSNGSPTVGVAPGAVIPYKLTGELSDTSSAGLALFSVDLTFSGGGNAGGGMPQAITPGALPMSNFAAPLGFTNPLGFGGTPFTAPGGVFGLRQVGGGQNTIRNTISASPTGNVILGIAQNGSPVDLALGTVNAPYQVGTFTLAPTNPLANVIRSGQAANPPFWKVDQAGNGALAPLTITVQAVRPNKTAVSVSNGETCRFLISAGPANAGRSYVMLGSLSGTTPGTALPSSSLTIPLKQDRYFEYTQTTPNGVFLQNSAGVLDANGRATVIFRPNARFEGQTAHHAFYLTGPVNFVSEAQPVLVVH